MRTPTSVAVRTATAIVMLFALGMGCQARAAAPIATAQVADDADLAHVEPSVAVDPAHPNNLLAATQLLATADLGRTAIGAYDSSDGGQTWQDVGPLPFPSGTNTGDDVTVVFDAGGHGFVAAMVTPEADGLMSREDRNVAVWRTDDGGRTFQAPVLAVAHEFVDHPWLAVDSMTGTLYVTWVADGNASAGFTRSTDGGRTFDQPRDVATPVGGVASPVVAAANGTVAVAYEVDLSGRDGFVGEDDEGSGPISDEQRQARDANVRIEVVGSADGGTTFGDPVAIGQAPFEPALPGDVHLPTGPSIAVEPTGAIDITYAGPPPYATGSAVLMAHTAGVGQPFDPPVIVNAAWSGDLPTFFQPQIALATGGGVGVSAFALADGRVDVVVWQASSAAGPFGPATRVTSDPFDPSLGLRGTKHGAWWIGDYQGLAAGGGMFHPLWNDTRTGTLQLFVAAVPVIGH